MHKCLKCSELSVALPDSATYYKRAKISPEIKIVTSNSGLVKMKPPKIAL